MLQLVYASAANVPFTAEALRELLARARTTNTGLDVSGVLLHVDGSFLQVLEGEHEVVEKLLERVGRDRETLARPRPRHA